MIDAVIVEVPNPGHPYGVRGVGETPIVAPPAAIANAIYRAVGVRMKELPMSPGRILRPWGRFKTAIKEKATGVGPEGTASELAM